MPKPKSSFDLDKIDLEVLRDPKIARMLTKFESLVKATQHHLEVAKAFRDEMPENPSPSQVVKLKELRRQHREAEEAQESYRKVFAPLYLEAKAEAERVAEKIALSSQSTT